MKKLRPVTLKRIVSFLENFAKESTCISSLTLSTKSSMARIKELTSFAKQLGLIKQTNSGFIEITPLGKKFLTAFKRGSSEEIHSIFMSKLNGYKTIYELYTLGITNSKRIHEITNLNAVEMDILIRLIQEVENLKAKNENDERLLLDRNSLFKVIIATYSKLSNSNRSKYVAISEIKNMLIKRNHLSEHLFNKVLEDFVKTFRECVILSQAPSNTLKNRESFTICGRRYSYIMIHLDNRCFKNANV